MSSLVVLDTNVVVSAAIHAEGAPARLVERVLSEETIAATCPRIVAEYRAVVARPKFRRLGLPPIWLDALLLLAHHRVRDPRPWPVPGPDPDDLVFLALAKATGAVLVTGNAAHFPPRIRLGVEVTNPASYLSSHPLAR